MTLDGSRRVAFASAAVAFVFLASTSAAIPVVWDEGEYIGRASQLITWFHRLWRLRGPQGGLHAFSAQAIHDGWPFYTFDEGHPAFAAIPIAIAKALFGGVMPELNAARLGTIVVFSAACGIIVFHLRTTFGAVAATVAAISLLTFPRLFSEAHFATLDAQLTAWWLILWSLDLLQRSDGGSLLKVGIVAGLTSATKFTGWLAWAPLTLARLLSRDFRKMAALLTIFAVGAATFFVVSPPLWHHPVQNTWQHFRLNYFHDLNVPIVFLGERYDIHRTLPWYNTLVWLAVVTPVPILFLGSLGLMRCLWHHDGPSVSLVLHWATLMIVRALPGVPPHDGIRLFLPAFGFWCVLAGVGAQQVWEFSNGLTRAVLMRGALVVALAGDLIFLARYYPQTLSHYNLLVGGVRGASALGMEPTYWWDSLDQDVLDWLNAHTGSGERVAFSSIANISLLHAWGRLHPAQAPRDGVFKWYVVQNRTGFLADSDRRLFEKGTPALVKYAGRGNLGHAPLDLRVPLLYIFPYEQYRAAISGRL